MLNNICSEFVDVNFVFITSTSGGLSTANESISLPFVIPLLSHGLCLPWQGALEELTEMLAEVVARPHLRKPRSEIIRLTRDTREKRMKLVKDVKKGLP